MNVQFIEIINEKNNAKALTNGLQYLINSLKDKHAQIRSSKDHSLILSYSGETSGNDTRDPKFVNNVINDISSQFSYQLLANNVGYLRIVGIGPGDVKSQADFIRNGLIDLKSKGVDKWIVDLRYNGGGNIEPMISGLAPLIGTGFIAGAIDKNEEIRAYTVENNQFYNYGRQVCKMENQLKINSKEPIAILLSRYTISSGELLAISFKGRKNTRFFGEETAGYTTGNSYEQLDEELVLIISQDVFIDRNKNRYDGKVGVDEYIQFKHNTNIQNDKHIEHALKWLEN